MPVEYQHPRQQYRPREPRPIKLPVGDYLNVTVLLVYVSKISVSSFDRGLRRTLKSDSVDESALNVGYRCHFGLDTAPLDVDTVAKLTPYVGVHAACISMLRACGVAYGLCTARTPGDSWNQRGIDNKRGSLWLSYVLAPIAQAVILYKLNSRIAPNSAEKSVL